MKIPTTRLNRAATLISLLLASAAQAQWIGSGAGGAGTDFTSSSNWNAGNVTGSFVNNTTNATIALSGNQSVGALSFYTTNTTATSLTITGDGAGANEVLSLGGSTIIARASTSATNHIVTFSNDLSVALGNSTRQIIGTGTTGSGGAIVNMGALVTGAGGLQLMGANFGVTLNLTNDSNDFTGPVTAERGVLNFTSIADFGTASALGRGTVGTSITINNVMGAFTGTTDQSSNRTFNMANAGAILANNSANNSKLTLSGNFTNNTATGLFGLGGTSTSLNEISGVIADGAFTGGLSKTGTGTWKLSGANTYTGATTIGQGILEVSSITSVGNSSASSLGKAGNTTAGTITMGGSGGATLRYVGTGDSSDRLFQIGSAGSSSSATINNNGTGALLLTGGITSTNTAQNQQRSFILDGSNTSGSTFGGNVAFSFSPTSAVNGANAIITKNGSGLWILGGSSSYTFTQFGGSGAAGNLTTNVNGGTLRINHANAISGGIAATGGTSRLSIAGGVLELTSTSGNFSRDTATTASDTTVQISSGGFSAFGGNRTVNLGGASATKTWGSSGFMTGGGSFILSSNASDSGIDFQNPIILGTTGNNTRTVQVNDGSAVVDAILSGNLSSTSGTQSFTKTGAGTLALTGTNSYTGLTTVSAGTLALSGSGTSAISVSDGAKLQFTLNDGLSPIASTTGNLTLGSNSTVLIVGTPAPATTYTLLSATSVSGTPVLASPITGFALVAESGSLKLKPDLTDTTAPVITLNGSDSVTIDWGSTYADAGATAADNVDPAVTVNTTNPVNTATPGTYTVSYNATDLAGNIATTATRTVTVAIANPTAPGADGLSPLMKYAFGANGPGDTVEAPALNSSATELTLTAYVRTNDVNLTITGETTTDLASSGSWTSTGVTESLATDPGTPPDGCVRKVFTVTIGGAKRFLRLHVSGTF